MDLKERIGSYVGGQMEIQNQEEGYLYRGEIERIAIEDNEVRVRFAWLAQGEGYPPVPNRWVANNTLDYTANLELYTASEIGDGRLCLNSRFVGELVVLFPKSERRLDPVKVEGLDAKFQ